MERSGVTGLRNSRRPGGGYLRNRGKSKNMRSKDIIYAGIAGTSAMTAFSYILSALRRKDFREPRLLKFLYQQWRPLAKAGKARKAGWRLHYSMGVNWAFLYEYLIRKKYLRPDRKRMVVAGVVSGIIAVACWKCMFGLSPARPPTNEKKFYLHLIPAHIVFAGITMELLRRSEAQGA